MDLDDAPEDRAFREEVRAFLATAVPEDAARKLFSQPYQRKADVVAWQRALNARGWATPTWPKEWGGPGWTPMQRYIFSEELLQWPAPEALSFNVTMVGPVLYTFGSQAQKERHLPKIANLDEWWCQGFSEPGAGSDLASLKTKAVREGDHYVVNGQKIWTSTAHDADWMFALVRTSSEGKKQEGISFLLIDMRTPGIEVRRIRTIDDWPHTNEVFLTDVRVPASNLVGVEGRGWDYAKFLLGNERTGIARVGLSKGRVRHAKAVAARQRTAGGTLAADPRFREETALLEVELKALEITAMRLLDADRRRTNAGPNPMSSILKIKGAELQQASAELMLKVAGPHALPARWDDAPDGASGDDLARLNEWAEGKASVYFSSRAASIYGGTNEIQHNILAKAVLDL